MKLSVILMSLGMLMNAALASEIATNITQNRLAIKTVNKADNVEQVDDELNILSCLPQELIWEIFKQLDYLSDGSTVSLRNIVNVSHTCKNWYDIYQDQHLWTHLRQSIHGDYPIDQATIKNAALQLLRTKVNGSDDPLETVDLVIKYNLIGNGPFQSFHQFLYNHCYPNITKTMPEYWKKIYPSQYDGYVIESKRSIKRWNKWLIDEALETINQNDYLKVTSEAAIAYNEDLIKKGINSALERKLSGLTYGSYGYKQNHELAKQIVEDLIKDNHPKAIHWKQYGLAKGSYGYEENLEEAYLLNEQLIQQGCEKAMKRKISDLEYGWGAYEQDKSAIPAFIDDMINKGHKEFMINKILGLEDGDKGYGKNPPEAYRLNELLITEGNEWAIRHKKQQILYGHDGYPQDTTYNDALNDALIEQGDENAIYRKIEGLAEGKYGYEKNIDDVRKFNDDLILKKNQKAIERKIRGLHVGLYGYMKNVKQAYELNESLIAQNNERALKRKLNGLEGGWGDGAYGYHRDLDAARKLNEQFISINDEDAIQQKICDLLIDSGIYAKDHLTLKNFITERRDAGHRWAQYLYAQGLKWGTFGFEQDRKAAKEYILKYHIPF